MKIKRYTGSNLQEAILKVKTDLGNEAIILNTRNVRQKGLRKFFSKPIVEVIAALDESKAESNSNLEARVNNMEVMLNKIYMMLQDDSNKPGINASPNTGYTNVMNLFYNNLVKNDVEDEIAAKLIESAKQKSGDKNINSVNEFVKSLYGSISEILKTNPGISLKNRNKPTVVLFTGPTGVGKTTTLAKIAAHFTINEKKSVAFVTTDTYRIAAVEQLKTYADILGIPLSVIYSGNEAENVLKEYGDKDLILVDTAGVSHKNNKQFEELKNIINDIKADEAYLVISMTSSRKNYREVIENYSFLKDYKLIFTKADEATTQGIIINTAFYTGKPVSYITTGQNVPDDIEVADVNKIIKSLLGSSK